MPYYSSYTSCGRLINNLKSLLDSKNLTSFKLSKISELSPTTTRKIYQDSKYIPSPDVLEKICIVLNVQPGDILSITPTIESVMVVCSGG